MGVVQDPGVWGCRPDRVTDGRVAGRSGLLNVAQNAMLTDRYPPLFRRRKSVTRVAPRYTAMTSPSNPMHSSIVADKLSFPEDESRHPWLTLLLEAYRITDAGVAEGIRREERQGRTLACARGCAACCRSHATIPVYPLELMGMTWYAVERLPAPLRARVRENLQHNADIAACPFLVDEACAIHPLRPQACRHFNVFGQACAEGEDAYYTRRQDVLTPIKRYMDQATDVMLPFYGMQHKAQRRAAIAAGSLHALATVMKDCNWPSVAARMAEHDSV